MRDEGEPFAGSKGPGRASVPAFVVFVAFLKLGLSSFGGPIAHLGYFRRELVKRRGWLSEADYDELVALCQFLPGPASSQTGFAIGLRKAGLMGGLAAFAGFTLPSAMLMLAAAYGLAHTDGAWLAPLLHGLKLVAVVIVAHAVMTMARANLSSLLAVIIAALAAALCLSGEPFAAPAAIGAAALAGLILPVRVAGAPAAQSRSSRISASAVLIAIYLALLAVLPLLRLFSSDPHLVIADAFYRSGALVFGGGHVVLPLLQAETRAMLAPETFLSGYGLAQALPGPLFSFAAYAGAMAGPAPPSLADGLIALIAIFLPGLLLVAAVDPIWRRVRAQPRAASLVRFASAAVVGVLAAALWRPVGVSAIASPIDAMIALAGFLALLWPRTPVIVVAVAVAGLGAAAALAG